ncbi:MAG TPA: erythromycin esterase family protein [Flavobacterium sp.]|jgi:erythromycin esterase-like protein
MRKSDITENPEAAKLLEENSFPLSAAADLTPLLERIGDARVVMLGEASHGTHEYYTWRAQISKRLIEEKGFSFIAVEGDWPDCYSINRYIKNYEPDTTEARDVLQQFNRWPTWMWANWEIAALADWLKNYNRRDSVQKAGFYGLDVYSLWESMQSILEYLEDNDPEAAKTAREAFSCFEPYREDEGQSYAIASRLVPELCEKEVVGLLEEIRRKMPDYDDDPESAFNAEQNALVAVNAEKYYRAMVQGGGKSWNVRDTHMQETLERLLELHGPESKAIVWAHNTHIGDARATNMARSGMHNIGELARKKFGEDNVVLIGFGSYSGTVIAGGSWGAPMDIMPVPNATSGSWEALLHKTFDGNRLILMDGLKKEKLFSEMTIGHRAIGVVYNPNLELLGNYVPSVLAKRYDAFIYLERTSALHPLHLKIDKGKAPETWPFGV